MPSPGGVALFLLGIKSAQGRNFAAEEDVPNGPAVCILSHELWKTRFGSRESIVGETIQLNNQSWQVVGVGNDENEIYARK